MFTYTKSLPLALLFSLPAFAMEQSISNPQQQDAQAVRPAAELLDTVFAARQYETSSASCAKLLAKKEAIEKQVSEAAKDKAEARNVLAAKIAEKDLMLAGILMKIEEQNAAKKAKDEEKAQKEADFKAYSERYTTAVQTIAATLGELKQNNETVLAERKRLQDILDGAKSENKSWSYNPLTLLGNLIGSSK